MTLVRLTLLAWVALLCLIGPARAQDARISLQLLCPKATAIAPLVEAAAATWRIRPVVLVAVMRVESGCRVDAVNKRTGARGLMQVLPGGSANADGLTRAELMDPATNLDLGARHLRRLINLCGALGPALGVYHGKRRCQTDEHARKVMGFVEWARKQAAKMRAPCT